jgi:hypothetical protein
VGPCETDWPRTALGSLVSLHRRCWQIQAEEGVLVGVGWPPVGLARPHAARRTTSHALRWPNLAPPASPTDVVPVKRNPREAV